MKLVSLCLLFGAVLHMSSAAMQVGTLYCLRDGNKYIMRLMIYHKTDPLTLMFSKDKDGVKVVNCDTTSNYITEDSTNGFYEVEVKYTGLVATSVSTCGAEQLSAGLSHYKWRFSTRTLSGATYNNLIFGSDMEYTATCDFDSVSESLVADRSISLTGSTLSTLTRLDENVDFEVRLQDDDSTVSTIPLGNDIYLYLKLNTVLNGATGVFAHSCKVCDTVECSSAVPEYVLTDANGCYLAGTHLGAAAASSFIGDGIESKTAQFENFVFNGLTKNLIFICKIGYCYGSNLEECINLCEARTVTRRKRDISRMSRQAENDDTNNTIALKLHIDIGDTTIYRQIPSISDGTMCTTRLIFIATSITIAALLFISILVSAALFYRLRRARKPQKN